MGIREEIEKLRQDPTTDPRWKTAVRWYNAAIHEVLFKLDGHLGDLLREHTLTGEVPDWVNFRLYRDDYGFRPGDTIFVYVRRAKR